MTPAAYVHRQTGSLVIYLVGAVVLFTAAMALAVFLPQGESAAAAFSGTAAVAFTVLLAMFATLTVEVTAQSVLVRFGPLPFLRKAIPLDRVQSAAVVRNSWWYGWGIRLTPHGWMWNVSGLDAVEVGLDSGRRFRIGTDDPTGLAAAIQAAAALPAEAPATA